MAGYLDSEPALDDCVWQAVHATPAVDLFTGLRDWRHPEAARPWGIDALLAAPGLSGALFRGGAPVLDDSGRPLKRRDFDALPRERRADLAWQKLFLDATPLCEEARAVLTAIGLLQLNPDERDLERHRAAFAHFSFDRHWARILHAANLSAVTTLCDPLSPLAAKAWPDGGVPLEPQVELPGFQTALDLDGLLAWDAARPRLISLGALKKTATGEIDKTAVAALLRFLGAWAGRSQALYFAARWCSGFDLGAKHHAGAKILRKCVLPFCARHGLALLLVFGGRPRQPEERQPAALDLESVVALGEAFPDNRFIFAGAGAREREILREVARRLPGAVFLGGAAFGADFGAMAPGALAHDACEGLAALGAGFVPFCSGATVPEQLLGRWAHARWALGRVLQEHYRALRRTGWRLTEKDVRRDVAALLQDNALRLCRRGGA